MTFTYNGIVGWEARADQEGHRRYDVTYRVISDDRANDGPERAWAVASLPTVGTAYSIGNDGDAWAFAQRDWTCRREHSDPGKTTSYLVTVPFSTKPMSRCQTTQWGNPLLEPYKISGGWLNYTREQTEDRDGLPYTMLSGEMMSPKDAEVDDARDTVKISFNDSTLDMATVQAAKEAPLNDATLWGLPAETVKLKKFTFSRQFYGVCNVYYVKTFEFEIRATDGWTREIGDRGKMVLVGADPTNPAHWAAAKDFRGENIPTLARADDGSPFLDPNTQTRKIHERNPYATSNLLLLGIPSTF